MSAFRKRLKTHQSARPLSYFALPPIKRIGPEKAARLSSSIPDATHEPIERISAPLSSVEAERAITYSPFLCRGLPRNENGRHRRMLHFCCPGFYPGVLLWPICHPTYLNNRQAWPRPVWRMTPYGMARLSQLFSQFR